MANYYGTPGSEVIDPLNPADDYIFADNGDDVAYGWDGDDVIDGWGGNDTLLGEYGDDKLLGWTGTDYLYGGSGDDKLYGEYDNDYLYGGTGDDILDGGTGGDTMYGGAGDDVYYVDASEEFYFDAVYEYYGEGIDTVITSANFSGLSDNVENITLTGTAYGANGNNLNNIMTGNDYDNFLWGNEGSDSLSGGYGNDILNGYGYGSFDEYDTLTGGAGADTFEIGSYGGAYYTENGIYGAGGFALVTDFNWGEGDKFKAHGSIQDYSLGTLNWYGTSALDTGIYYKGDLIAVAQDRSGSDVLLSADFNYVS